MMSLTTAYATAEEYRKIISMTDTGKDSEILKDLAAISRYLEGKLGRFFNKEDEATVRIYIPEITGIGIYVDDMAEVPELVRIDTGSNGLFETELVANDYELQPLNADKKPEPWPWERIELTPWGSLADFKAGERVQVTAKFGWPAVPAAIKSATVQLTAILRLETPRATRRIAELGDTIEASQDAQSIIRQITDNYKIWRA